MNLAPALQTALTALLLSTVASSQDVHPVRTSGELIAAVAALSPGDAVLLAPGTYSVPALSIRDAHGLPDRWIAVRSESGSNRARIVGSGAGGAVLDIRDCSYLRFEDLELESQAASGTVHGVLFPHSSTSRHVVFDRCFIHDVTGTGVLSAARLLEDLQLEGCEIARCDDSGVNLGNADPWDARIAAHTRISGCYIHHTSLQPQSQWSYGIHIKPWSHGSRIEDNVIHDVGTTSGAAIALYGPSIHGHEPPERWNVVRRNVLWDSNGNHARWPYEGIFVTNSAVVENNIVLAMRHGISVETWYQGWMGSEHPIIDNLTIRNNTVYNCRHLGIGVRTAWAMAPSCTIANNASLMIRTGAESYRFDPELPGSVSFSDNGFFGPTSGVTRGLIALSHPDSEFVQTGSPPVDLYPQASSGLRDAGSGARSQAIDFNGIARPAGTGVDLGAYEWTQPSNPGWRPAAGFKPPVAPLRPASQEVAAGAGGTAGLELHAAPGAAYAVLASAVGPSSEGWVPVVPDPWTAAAWSPALAAVFVGYAGTIPASGVARMQLRVQPVPLPIGVTLYHGAIVAAAQLQSSNVVRVVLRP